MAKTLIIKDLSITLLKMCFCTAAVKHKKTGKNTRFSVLFTLIFEAFLAVFHQKTVLFALIFGRKNDFCVESARRCPLFGQI